MGGFEKGSRLCVADRDREGESTARKKVCGLHASARGDHVRRWFCPNDFLLLPMPDDAGLQRGTLHRFGHFLVDLRMKYGGHQFAFFGTAGNHLGGGN